SVPSFEPSSINRISKRPSGAITSRSAATIGAILAASLCAGSTTEKSGGGAAMAQPCCGSAASLWGAAHTRATAPVDTAPVDLGNALGYAQGGIQAQIPCLLVRRRAPPFPRVRGAHCCALSPCGRGRGGRSTMHGWVRGTSHRKAQTPHPLRLVDRPSCPLPQ